MASRAIQTFRRTVTVDWPEHAKEDAKARLLRIAAEGHAEIMARQGNPQFDAYANRPGNRDLASVELPGPIVYTYKNLRQLVEFALDELRKASPVISGDYVRSHTLFVNDSAVDVLPDNVLPTDEIMIANPVPYSRRLEIGKTKSGRDFVIQVPNRIYERVVKRKLRPRYHNVANITFTYVQLSNAYITKGKLSPTYATGAVRKQTQKHGGTTFAAGGLKMRKRNQKPGTPVRVPAIIIRPHQ